MKFRTGEMEAGAESVIAKMSQVCNNTERLIYYLSIFSLFKFVLVFSSEQRGSNLVFSVS